MPQDDLGDLVADGERRVERGHRLLEDHRDSVATQLSHRGFGELQQIDAVEHDLAARDTSWRIRDEAHDRQSGHALPAPGLADNAERASRFDAEADVVDRGKLATFGRERGPKPPNLEESAQLPPTLLAPTLAALVVDLERTKTDAIDAVGIARFAAQKRPPATPVPDALTEELRELVHLRARLLQDFGDRVRQLHRLVDLGFPEFTRYVRTLDSELAVAILRDYPTAAAYRGVSVRRLAALRYDGRHQVGLDLARTLIDAARRSVGQHHSATYRVQIRYACDDLDVLRHRLRDIDRDSEGKLRAHEVGRLLTTINGINIYFGVLAGRPSCSTWKRATSSSITARSVMPAGRARLGRQATNG